MAALNETRNALHNEAAGIASQGLLLKSGGSGVELTDGVTDLAIGVSAAESSRDAAGAIEDGTAVDATVAVYPLSGIVYVKCEAIAVGDADFGIPLYVGATDGFVSSSSANSAKKVGHLFQSGEAISAGDLVAMACIGVGL
tara:strand:- start:314 stop:736 length:423 start_codon:yes stop_codon:yes gene_type:complete